MPLSPERRPVTVLAVLLSLTALGFVALASAGRRALLAPAAVRRRRDSAAHEPPGARHRAVRAGWLGLAVLCGAGAFQTWTAVDVTTLRAGQARSIVDEAASDLRAQPHLREPSKGTFERAVDDAVLRAATERGAETRPTTALAGGGARVGLERYDVTMDEGAHRFCLVITPSESGGVGVAGAGEGMDTSVPAYDLAATVTKGRCGG